MDLKSFQKSHPNDQKHKQDSTKDDLRKTAESYAQKTDNELLSEIIKTAQKGKADGSISNEDLNRFATSVSPMLNEEQRARLQSVLDIINRD